MNMKKSSFEPLNPAVRFPAIEGEILEFWKKEEIFAQSLKQSESLPSYVFYDGPPFATGLPHYGHLLAGTLKDIIPRYWTMRGHYVSRRFGWDCHGLPVENEMEKEFNVSGKRDIEKLGTYLFNEACRSIVLRYTGQWERVVLRMGRWVDFVRQYRTMDPPFMESIWWVFKQVWNQELIYQGFRVQPYCPRCATPLSNFEVNEGYRDVKGPSITVTFPLVDDPQTKFLVWTTTPWTLPSNVVLATGAAIPYVKVRHGEEIFILAKDRLSSYFHDPALYFVLEELPGSALAGLRYQPLFDYFASVSPDFFQVVTAEFVSTEDGTGIVHIAPAFGEDDFQVGQHLGLPIVCPVDEEGKFTGEVPPWQGKLVFDADEEITLQLKKAGRLLQRGKIEHRYPFCYRCDSALIYKAITTWFMKIEPLKANMLANNQNIRWVPDHLQNGRFGKGIESAPDWNISRNRYWGTPIPVWLCECGHRECVGSLEDLHRLAGKGDLAAGEELHRKAVRHVSRGVREEAASRFQQFNIDPQWAEKIAAVQIDDRDIHIHVVDQLEIACPACGQMMRRTPEVLDCWFESGSMPYAQNHYPFENKEIFDSSFPADFIAEGLDQTRGWFYTLTVLSAALFRKEAFKNVVVNGIILAEDGKKLSKRLKNYAPPEEVLESLGADALRLFLINSPAVKAEDLRFSEKGVTEMSRAVLLPFWNAYSFFVTYANVDGWRPEGMPRPVSDNELDQWIVSVLNHVIVSVNREMDAYNLYRVVPLLVDFIDNLTNWYIRRSRRRFWKSENDVDKSSAYQVLYYVLVTFSKVMAPFLPFVTEAIYRNLVAGVDPRSPISVHLCNYPMPDESWLQPELEEKMATIRQVVGMARALRNKFNLKNRQPLASLDIVIKDDALRQRVSGMAGLIREEINVKQVNFDDNEDVVVTLSAKPDYRKLGKRFGSKMKEAAVLIEKLQARQIHELEAGVNFDVLGQEVSYADLVIQRTQHAHMEVETQGGITVALDTEITPELLAEGHAREFVSRVQNLRKEADFNVIDRIRIFCTCGEELKTALTRHLEYIQTETLAEQVEFILPPTMAAHPIEVNDLPVEIAVVRV
jgi:isoleucyl-tRNA synthetase